MAFLHHLMVDAPTSTTELVAVLDMGASAIRLVVAEISPGRPIRIIEEASRGVLLGRDTFSTERSIRPQTMDATFAALEGFRQIMDGYGVRHLRAVATSAVREARNGQMFLDRIRGRTGITFDIINEAAPRPPREASEGTLPHAPNVRGYAGTRPSGGIGQARYADGRRHSGGPAYG
jgi:hypothetical protein